MTEAALPTIPPHTLAALNDDAHLRLAVMEIALASTRRSTHPDLPPPAPWNRDVPIHDDGADQVLAALRDAGLTEPGGRHRSQGERETLHLTEPATLWLGRLGFHHHGEDLIRDTRMVLFGEDWPDRAEALGFANGWTFSFLHDCGVEGVVS